MKWDIKSYRFSNMGSKDFEYSNDYQCFNDQNNELCTFYYDNNINDIYPNNYYKITESYSHENEDEYEDIYLSI